MNDFQPVYPENSNLDPYKHVNYSNGLVLGVDEFNQQELYLIEKNRLHNRGLHGYGTVCGLKVDVELKAEKWQIKVAPGIAINPRGEEIRVPEAQCAVLDNWIGKNLEELEQKIGSPAVMPGSAPIYLVLCYAECKTDFIPIPSGPCQSLDKTSVASRVADDFEMKLQLEPPKQVEEDKIQELIELLHGIEISSAPDGMDEEEMARLVLGLRRYESPMSYSPPVPGHMHPDDAERLIQVAMRTWVTDVKPQLLAANRNCASGPPRESCVLLGVVHAMVDTSASPFSIVGPVTVDEDDRPFLLQTRLIQEHLLKCCGSSLPAIVTSPPMASPSVTSPPLMPPFDESNLMHLTGDESSTGSKTFNDQIVLATNGRVQRRLLLTPAMGMPTNSRAEPAFFNASTPALRYVAGGEAAFTLQIPDDIDFSVAPQVRLVWGSKIKLDAIKFIWNIRNRFAGQDASISPYIGTGGIINDTVPNVAAGHVFATAFLKLPDSVTVTDIFGALRLELGSLSVSPVSSPPSVEIYLLHVEISYVANRLGRLLP